MARPWLFLSADGSPARNREIAAQRLDPRHVVSMDTPDPAYGERVAELEPDCGATVDGDDRLFARCILKRRGFHVDAYGGMSWCSFIKDPALRYDLRQGTFPRGLGGLHPRLR